MRWTLLVFLLSLLSLALSQTTSNCENKFSESGNSYSLKGLSAGEDASAIGPNGQTYYYQPCATVSQQGCTDSQYSDTAVCQKTTQNPPQFNPCGLNSDVTWTEDTPAGGGFKITFSGGSDNRKADIHFTCKKGQDGTFGVGTPPEDPTHNYHLTWLESDYGCPTKGGGGGGGGGGSGDKYGGMLISGGWVFILCLVGLIIVYLIAGMIYKKFIAKVEWGIEIIPNVEFWMASPFLFKDGHLFIFQNVMKLVNKARGKDNFEEF